MSEYAELLKQVGGDPRLLAAAAQNHEVAAMLGLENYYFPTRQGLETYETRLKQVGGNPRLLAAAAQNHEVAAMLGLSL